MVMPTTMEGWADWACEQVNYQWGSSSNEHVLGKIALFSFFLDGKTIAENAPKLWLRLAARLYGVVVRARVRLGFYAFMPEVRAIRWEYHNSQRRKDRSRRNRYEHDESFARQGRPAVPSTTEPSKE